MIRRSFGGGNNGMGGGGVFRTVGTAVTRTGGVAGTGSSSSSSSTNSTAIFTSRRIQKPNYPILSSASPFSTNLNGPNNPPSFSSASQCDDYEWVSADGSEDERGYAFVDDFFLGSVPSVTEVQNAVSALQQVFDTTPCSQLVKDKFTSNLDTDGADRATSPTGLLHRVSSAGSELDWMEPSVHLCGSQMLQSRGFYSVYDAFHLLQTEPAVQRMVVSLSSDKAVWDAVLKNEVVRELRESYSAVEDSGSQDPDKTSNFTSEAMNVAKWIFDNTKANVIEVFKKITKLVNELFTHSYNEESTAEVMDPFEEKLGISFMLSIVVLLVVVLTRANRI